MMEEVSRLIATEERSVREVFRDLKEHLRETGFLPEEYFALSTLMENQQNALIPEYRRLACFAVTGISEGHYVRIEAIEADEQRTLLFLGKTFAGFDRAYDIARECARALGA